MADQVHEPDLLGAAREVSLAAHAPYSGLRVGCVLLDDEGGVHVGCNVENASYGLTVCAERSALAAYVAASGGREPRPALVRAAIWTSGETPLTPCGACRQCLHEFAPALAIEIGCENAAARTLFLNDLLPDAFDGARGG
jgi:cytidine deaminase